MRLGLRTGGDDDKDVDVAFEYEDGDISNEGTKIFSPKLD